MDETEEADFDEFEEEAEGVRFVKVDSGFGGSLEGGGCGLGSVKLETSSPTSATGRVLLNFSFTKW